MNSEKEIEKTQLFLFKIDYIRTRSKRILSYPLENRNVGAESRGSDVSVGREIPASFAATITDNGGLAAAIENFVISMLSCNRYKQQRKPQ